MKKKTTIVKKEVELCKICKNRERENEHLCCICNKFVTTRMNPVITKLMREGVKFGVHLIADIQLIPMVEIDYSKTRK
jgi:hypothetical protein